jgi:hypothetical protein
MSTDLSYVLTEDNVFTDEIHEEVDLILNCSGPDIMELVATDPGYYLDIISRYNKTRDGRDIYLPDLCNIIITKNSSEYRIKFKLTDNGSWYEVGFTGQLDKDFSEKDVHEAFTRKVNYALNRPADSHRAMLLDTLQPGTKKGAEVVPEPVQSQAPVETMSTLSESTPAPMRSQGDQTKLSKIDRFMGRTTAAASTLEESTAPVVNMQTESVSAPPPPPPKEKQVRFDIPAVKPPVTKSTQASALSELDILRSLCPEERKAAYDNLVNLLRSNDLFYLSLIDLLPRLTSGQRCLVISFLQN